MRPSLILFSYLALSFSAFAANDFAGKSFTNCLDNTEIDMDFGDSQMSLTSTVFANQGCSGDKMVRLSVAADYAVVGTEAVSDGINYKMDVTLRSMQGEVFRQDWASNLNANGTCGHSDWNPNSPINLLGSSCADGGTAGETSYTIIRRLPDGQISPGIDSEGHDGKTPERRHVRVEKTLRPR